MIIYLIFLDSFCPEYKEKVAELLAKTDELMKVTGAVSTLVDWHVKYDMS